jgi:hypothetical protein
VLPPELATLDPPLLLFDEPPVLVLPWEPWPLLPASAFRDASTDSPDEFPQAAVPAIRRTVTRHGERLAWDGPWHVRGLMP